MIYGQKHLYKEIFKAFGADPCLRLRVPFLPPSRALLARDGATREDYPSQAHGSSPAALQQKPRCMADSRDSIVPGQSSFSPRFDAELPAVPAPQRVMLHPHQLHISTS